MVSYNLIFNNKEYKINIIIKRTNKNIYLRVTPPNIIVISTPRLISKNYVESLVMKNIKKVEALFNKRLNNKSNQDPNILHFFGKAYNLKLILANENKALLLDNTIYIYANNLEKITIKGIVNSFYEKNLKEFIDNNIEEVKRNFNINRNIEVIYKDVKSYFGECFYKKDRIILALRLAKYEPKYILDVLNHEMAHFYIHNHQKEFYQLLEKVNPGYKKTQISLKHIKFSDIY